MLFAGSYYYPSGGWNDFIGYFSEKEAEEYLIKNHYDWAHLVIGGYVVRSW